CSSPQGDSGARRIQVQGGLPCRLPEGRMNPLHMHRELTDSYRKFVQSSQRFKNADIEAWVERRIDEEQFLWREPLLTIRRRYRYGPELKDLVSDGHLHDVVLKCFTTKPGDASAPVVRPWLHQTDA